MSGTQHEIRAAARETQTADMKFNDAVMASRSLLFYTLTATLPLVVLAAVLLFTNLQGRALMWISWAGALTGFGALGRLLYEMTLDVAGYPDYKLPVWAVFYLIIYLISAFTFVLFALHVGAPGHWLRGLGEGRKAAWLDTLYLSLSNYIGVPPDPSLKLSSQLVRFLCVIEGVLSLFINVVIITKFVNTF